MSTFTRMMTNLNLRRNDMAKQCKIGDVVVINGIKARIEENNDGNCEQCILKDMPTSVCFEACGKFGDCFDFDGFRQMIIFKKVD